MEGDPALQKKVGGGEGAKATPVHTYSFMVEAWDYIGGTFFGSRMQDEVDFLRFSS